MSWFRKAQAPAATAAAAAAPSQEAGTVKVGMTVNGKAASADVDPQNLAGAVPAREFAADRHACGLRYQPVRGLRGASGRHAR